MQRPLRLVSLVPALLVALLLFSGCKQIQRYLPPTTIDNPTPGSPEHVVYKFFEGSLKSDVLEAWETVRPLVHSGVLELSSSESSFLNNNFKSFLRKKDYLLVDPSKPVYKRKYAEDLVSDKEVRIFVVNVKSDMPSPFRLERDPQANNEWRIRTIP